MTTVSQGLHQSGEERRLTRHMAFAQHLPLPTKTGHRRDRAKPDMSGEERRGAEDSRNHGHGFVSRLTKTDQDSRTASLYRNHQILVLAANGLHERRGAEPNLESLVSALFFPKTAPSPLNPVEREVWPTGIVATTLQRSVSQGHQSSTNLSRSEKRCRRVAP